MLAAAPHVLAGFGRHPHPDTIDASVSGLEADVIARELQDQARWLPLGN